MSNARDLGDSAAIINFIDGLTSDVQQQLNTLDPLPSQTGQSGKYLTTDGTDASWGTVTTDPTLGTLTKTFTSGETASISLTSSVLAPVVSVTKEIPQTGSTNNSWDVNSTTENYTRLDSAAATTLSFNALGVDTSSYIGVATTLSEATDLYGFRLSTDGTKMFVASTNTDSVYQYSLSTAYDVSTASYDSVSFSVASQETAPSGLAFNNDGTKMFIIGYVNNTVYEYTLSTGFDLSTASYSQSLSVAAQANFTTSLDFNDDGTKMYVLNYIGTTVYQYSLSTGFDVSTASYDSIAQNVGGNAPYSLIWSNGGKTLTTLSTGNNYINQRVYSTPYDLSTVVSSVSFLVSGQLTNEVGIVFASDKFYVLAVDGTIHEYSLLQELQLGTGSFASADVGKTIEANSGAFVLKATDGSYAETTAPTSYAQVASGDWSMYGVVYNAAGGDLELSAYSDVYNLAIASYDSKSFNVGGQAGNPYGMCFNSAGTKLYVMHYFGTVFQYTLSTAWDVSTASYDSISFSVTGQTTAASDIKLNNAGTKMYVLAENNRNLFQYSLSTADNVSTASYDSVSILLSSLDTAPEGFVFSSDGTKMYFVGISTDSVYRYDLTTAFDLSTASYSSQSLSVAAKDTRPNGVAINNNGTSLYVAGDSSNAVHEYALSTAYSLSTAQFVRTFSVAAQNADVESVVFGAGGAKMYIVGTGVDIIYQYSTGTGVAAPTGYHPVHTTSSTDTEYWTDINSMTADQNAGSGEVYYAISTDDRTTWTVIDNTDGERDIVRNNAGTWQYNSNGTYASETWVNGATNTELATLAEAMEGASSITGTFDVSTAAYSQSFSIASQDGSPQGVAFNSTGTKMFIVGEDGNDVNEYTLSTGFNVSTASYSQNFSVSSQDTSPRDIAFNADGTKMFIAGRSGNAIYEYTLSTGYDVSTSSFVDSLSIFSQESEVEGLTFSTDGTKMFIVGGAGDEVNEYDLTTGFDLSTASFSQNFSVSAQETQPFGISFNTDGTKMLIVGATGRDVNEYNLTTGFDVSTASFVDSFSVSSQAANPNGIAFNTNGTKMFITCSDTDNVYEYTIGTTSYTNQMDKTQLDAVTDPNHIALGDDLDLAIVFNMTSGSAVPSSDGVAINYDANVLNKGAVLGTDYDFDAPAQNSVRITALAGNNLKVRII